MANLSHLPSPLYGTYGWQERANCRGVSAESFFSPDSERRGERLEREKRAKACCRGCEVIDACLRHALVARETDGVWGGLSSRERSLLVLL